MSAELLSAAAKREAPQLDEKLYLEVFAPPKRAAALRHAPSVIAKRPSGYLQAST
jgi:hypothetical protein